MSSAGFDTLTVAADWRVPVRRQAIPAATPLPRSPQSDAGPLQCLSHRLVVTLLAIRQPLAGPAVLVQPNGFAQPFIRDALPPQRHASPAKVSGHRGSAQSPTRSKRGHVVAGLVLADQLLNLLGCQPALRLSRLHRSSTAMSAAKQGRQPLRQPPEQD